MCNRVQQQHQLTTRTIRMILLHIMSTSTIKRKNGNLKSGLTWRYEAKNNPSSNVYQAQNTILVCYCLERLQGSAHTEVRGTGVGVGVLRGDTIHTGTV